MEKEVQQSHPDPKLAAEETTTTTESATEPPSGSPPNGGVKAWLQVASAFLLFFNSWGMINTYGVFQEYFQTHSLSSMSPSNISWLGTVQGFLLIVISVLTGPLFDLGYLSGLMVAGTGLIVVGFLFVAEVQQYSGIFLSLSLLVGLGSGCLYVPSIATVSQYFTTKRPMATGITSMGGSLGGVIFPIVFKRALDSVGYAWACRILAFIVLGSQLLPLCVLRVRSVSGKKRTLLEPEALKDPAFALFSCSLFFACVGLYAPMFYIATFAREVLEVDSSLTFYLLSILNAGSVLGRLLPNLIAIYAGSMNTFLFCVTASGVLVFCWIPIQNLGGLIAFAILYGFFSGAVVSLPPTALLTLSPDLSKAGTRMGMSFGFGGFGILVGNPIAGALLRSRFSFQGLQVFSGVAFMMAVCLLTAAILVHQLTKKREASKDRV